MGEKIGNQIKEKIGIKYLIIGLFMFPFIVIAVNMLIDLINLDEITFWVTTIFWWWRLGWRRMTRWVMRRVMK